QRCTASSRLVVNQAVYSEFRSKLVERAKALRLGDGLDASTDVGPVINEAQLRRIHEYTGIGRAEGAKLLCGGENERSGDCNEGWLYCRKGVGAVDPEVRIAEQE